MKRKVLVALTLLALTPSARADEPPPADQKIHRAESGDTLWDLSGRYWNDVRAWPELWALNPHFHNPHWISPGEPVYLDPRGAVAVVRLPVSRTDAGEGARPLPAGAQEQGTSGAGRGTAAADPPRDLPRPEVTCAKAQAQDFIAPRRIAPAAVIRNRRFQKEMYGAGETVEIDLPKGSTVAPGDLLTAYEDSVRVLHPANRTLQGYHVRVLGQVKIRAVAQGRAEGDLLETYDAVGDRTTLMAHRPPVTGVVPLEPKVRLEGVVIQGPLEKTLFSSQDVVFLDRGTLHGVRPGLLLEVPLPPSGRSAEGFSELDSPLARLMILSTEEKTSAGLVLESRTSVSVGDRFVASARP